MRTLMTGDIVILQFDMRHGYPAILGPHEWLYPTPWRSGDRLLQAVTVARRVVSLSETIISAQRLRPIWHFVSLAATAEFIRRVPVCHRFPQIPGTGRLYCLLQLPPNRVYMVSWSWYKQGSFILWWDFIGNIFIGLSLTCLSSWGLKGTLVPYQCY